MPHRAGLILVQIPHCMEWIARGGGGWMGGGIDWYIRVQWLLVIHEMRCFYGFSESLDGISDVNG